MFSGRSEYQENTTVEKSVKKKQQQQKQKHNSKMDQVPGAVPV